MIRQTARTLLRIALAGILAAGIAPLAPPATASQQQQQAPVDPWRARPVVTGIESVPIELDDAAATPAPDELAGGIVVVLVVSVVVVAVAVLVALLLLIILL